MHTATNAPLGIGSFFGGVVAGVVSVVLSEVCVLGVVKWRQRIKEPASSKERVSIWFVLTSKLLYCILGIGIAYLCNGLLCYSAETQLMTVWALLMSLLPWRWTPLMQLCPWRAMVTTGPAALQSATIMTKGDVTVGCCSVERVSLHRSSH